MLCKVVVNKLLRMKGLSLIGCILCSGPGPFALRARTRVRGLSLVDEGGQEGCKALGVPAWLGALRRAGPSGLLRGSVRPVAPAWAGFLGRNRPDGPPFAPVTRAGLYWPRFNHSSH